LPLPITQVGDAEFAAWYAANVNTRRVMYLGSAVKMKDTEMGFWYGVGDMIPQVPPGCLDLPGKALRHNELVVIIVSVVVSTVIIFKDRVVIIIIIIIIIIITIRALTRGHPFVCQCARR
jgi:hypothetical protein